MLIIPYCTLCFQYISKDLSSPECINKFKPKFIFLFKPDFLEPDFLLFLYSYCLWQNLITLHSASVENGMLTEPVAVLVKLIYHCLQFLVIDVLTDFLAHPTQTPHTDLSRRVFTHKQSECSQCFFFGVSVFVFLCH